MTRELLHHEVRQGVAWLTLDDLPVNGDSHERSRQRGDRILPARRFAFEDAHRGLESCVKKTPPGSMGH